MTIKFSKDHEWVNAADANAAVVGITVHAQDALGDVVFVETPAVGSELSAGSSAGVVESVKAASDIYSPIDGTVLATNPALEGEPELVNSDPYGEGWMFRLQPANPAQINDMLDAAAYSDLIGA